jgi:hypothetical protein
MLTSVFSEIEEKNLDLVLQCLDTLIDMAQDNQENQQCIIDGQVSAAAFFFGRWKYYCGITFFKNCFQACR